MRKLVIAATFAFIATSSQAQVVESIVGAGIGAALCSQIGDGNGQVIAMAVCAVAGSKIGENMGRPKYPHPQYVEIRPQGGYATGPMYDHPSQAPGYCDPVYYEGRYDPAAAQYYCRGVAIRQQRDQQRRQEEAYHRGVNGY
jgi:hypothetical protein